MTVIQVKTIFAWLWRIRWISTQSAALTETMNQTDHPSLGTEIICRDWPATTSSTSDRLVSFHPQKNWRSSMCTFANGIPVTHANSA